MLRVCTSAGVAAGVMTAVAVAAPQAPKAAQAGSAAARDLTLTGCVAAATQPNAYILDVIGDATADGSPAGAVAPGTPVRLAGLPAQDFQDYVGQQVEVLGMVLQRGSARRPAKAAGNPGTQVIVRWIRQVATACSTSAPAAATAAVPAKPAPPVIAARSPAAGTPAPAARPGARSSRVAMPNRPVSIPAPPATSPVPGWTGGSTLTSGTPGGTAPTGSTPTSTTPTGTAPTGSTPTSTAPGGTATGGSTPTSTGTATSGTAPANSTSTNAGLGQTGVSGTATLSGTVAMTPPTITFPIGSGTLPTSGSSSVVPSPTNGLAQGATNTTTSTAGLDQTGITGDAMLSGLVNVNIQQLLASVQLIANINVQDVVVNVSDILNDNQIQALVQALNTNPQAAINAADLTSALQQAGVLDPNQWVVGVTGAQVYENKDLTTALQSRGIIQPSETILGTSTPHIFVTGDQ